MRAVAEAGPDRVVVASPQRSLTAAEARRSALVISECQMGMVDDADPLFPGLAAEAVRRSIVPSIARLARAFRAAGMPVAHSLFVPRVDYSGTGENCPLLARIRTQGRLREGDPAAAVHPELTPQPGDLVVSRIHTLSPFSGTGLATDLRHRGVHTVVLVGVSTDLALPIAAADAVSGGFSVVIPEDCTAGASPKTHAFIVEHTLPLLAELATSTAVIGAVEASHR
jgi:nicotinamidase-related amidase